MTAATTDTPRRRRPSPLPGSAYARSVSLIVLAAITGPVWKVILVPLPGVSLTVGRLIIGLATVALALDLRRDPAPRPRLPRDVVLLAAGIAALWLWTVANATIWGCRCQSEVAGFSELAAITVLAAVAALLEPRVRYVVVVAVLIGAASTALLTVAGVEGLTPGAQNRSTIQERTAGPFGNPNLLAFSLAFAPAAALAVGRDAGRRARLVLLAVLALVVVLLLTTYSRGGLLAAAAGLATAAVVGAAAGRSRRWTFVGVVLVAVVATVAYPEFAQLRRNATSVPPRAQPETVDRSGWDARNQGLVPVGGARLANPATSVLSIVTSRADMGVSRQLAPTDPTRVSVVRLEARSAGAPIRLRLGLQDNLRGNGPAARNFRVTSAWRGLRLRWRPAAPSPEARVYLRLLDRPGQLQIRAVRVVSRGDGGDLVTTVLPTTLQGLAGGEPDGERGRAKEERDIASRRVGAELTVRAFLTQPVRGIGWGRFRDFAARESGFGRLATHNEYLRYLAELGLVGFGLLVGLGLIIGRAATRKLNGAADVALLGILVTGAAGLLFINGLVASSVAMPLALAAGVVCARAGPRSELAAGPTPPWWPGRDRRDVQPSTSGRLAAVRRRVAAVRPRRGRRP